MTIQNTTIIQMQQWYKQFCVSMKVLLCFFFLIFFPHLILFLALSWQKANLSILPDLCYFKRERRVINTEINLGGNKIYIYIIYLNHHKINPNLDVHVLSSLLPKLIAGELSFSSISHNFKESLTLAREVSGHLWWRDGEWADGRAECCET